MTATSTRLSTHEELRALGRQNRGRVPRPSRREEEQMIDKRSGYMLRKAQRCHRHTVGGELQCIESAQRRGVVILPADRSTEQIDLDFTRDFRDLRRREG